MRTFTYFNLTFLCTWLQVMNKVKVTSKETYSFAGGLHLTQMRSFCIYNNGNGFKYVKPACISCLHVQGNPALTSEPTGNYFICSGIKFFIEIFFR